MKLNTLAASTYDHLRAIASHRLRQERRGHTLQPTALVNEVFVRLLAQRMQDWQSRTQFVAVCSTFMRQILVDHARSKQRLKRTGSRSDRTTLGDDAHAERASQRLLSVDETVRKLALLDPELANIAELRLFGQLTLSQIASHLDVSERTIRRRWALAKMWLQSELSQDEHIAIPGAMAAHSGSA